MKKSRAVQSIQTRYFIPLVLGVLSIVLAMVAFIFVCTKTDWNSLWLHVKKVFVEGPKVELQQLTLLLVIFSLIILSIIFSMKYFLDIPFVFNNQYIQITGAVVELIEKGEYGDRYLTIIDSQSGNVIKITIGYGQAITGEICTIIYLPDSRVGAIIS